MLLVGSPPFPYQISFAGIVILSQKLSLTIEGIENFSVNYLFVWNLAERPKVMGKSVFLNNYLPILTNNKRSFLLLPFLLFLV